MLQLLLTVPVIFLALGSVSSAGELYDAALAGDDMGTSNHDPYATDKSHWVKTGPHVMIVGKAAQEMAGSYPHEMKADPTHPYVMFPGTKYQH